MRWPEVFKRCLLALCACLPMACATGSGSLDEGTLIVAEVSAVLTREQVASGELAPGEQRPQLAEWVRQRGLSDADVDAGQAVTVRRGRYWFNTSSGIHHGMVQLAHLEPGLQAEVGNVVELRIDASGRGVVQRVRAASLVDGGCRFVELPSNLLEDLVGRCSAPSRSSSGLPCRKTAARSSLRRRSSGARPIEVRTPPGVAAFAYDPPMKPQDAPIDLPLAFERQRAAWSAAPFPTWPERADRLARLQRLLLDHEAAIARAIDADFGGRPAIETELAEVWPSLEEIKGALRHGRRWMRPRRAGVGKWFQPARAQVLPQPLGVVGIIVPWNYPLYLAIGPLVAALAAGNRAMVKLSEFNPAFAALMQQLCARLFAPEEVCIVTGGAEVAAQFAALPFDHLLFTGSTTVGRKVMAAAAANLTPVTLELGGKSPAVITPGYPLAHAVQRILAGKLLNAGQTCIAPDYVLLPRASVADFVDAARTLVRRGYPGGLADANYCSIVDQRQYRRLLQHLDEAAARGARSQTLFDGASRDDARHRLAPTLLIDPPADCAAMREEIFGPLLPLVPYDRVEEITPFVKARPRPLALYWFDHDGARIEQALQALPAGGVTVNDTLLHITQESLPFGGVGASGMGHYHGQWGFDTFSKLKPVFRQSRFNAMALFLPPYGPTMRRLLGLMKRL